MTETDPSHASDVEPGGLPAEWSLSRVTETATRAVNLLAPAPAAPPAPAPAAAPAPIEPPAPAAKAAVPQAAPRTAPRPTAAAARPTIVPPSVKDQPVMRDVDPDIFGAIGDWQERQALTQPRARELRPAETQRYVPPPQYQPPYTTPAQPQPQPAAAPQAAPQAATPQAAPAKAAAKAAPKPAAKAAPAAEPAEDVADAPESEQPAPARRRIQIAELLASLRFWQSATAVLSLLCVVLLVSALSRPARFDVAIAPIGVVNAPAPLYLAETGSSRIRLTALADIDVPKTNDLQLWMFAPNSDKPVSLGVLPPAGGVFNPAMPPVEGSRLVISLEPHGGTTGGKITGKVLYGGTLANR